MSAEQLSVEPFQGLLEVVQNADDLHASEVRVAVRKGRDHDTLLVVHDGERVHLDHAIAMALSYVSTKREDPRAKGRHGIGLKTLGRIGESLSVHCHPYHFSIEHSRIRPSPPARSISDFYDARSTETLLQLRLRSDFDVDKFRSWVEALGAQALIFLDSMRSLRLINLGSRRATAHHRLRELRSNTVTLPNVSGPVERTVLGSCQ